MSRISVKFSLAWTVLWMNSSFYHATASSVSYYQIDPASAYTWPGGYPQSCRCAQNLVRRDQCTLFDCTCICDTTALQCDYNCCCDPDCSTDQISRFNSLGICSTATYSPSTIQHCYSSLQLQSVNPRTPMGGNPTARTAVGDALCVVQQNNVQESFYYTDTSLQPSSVFTTSQGSKDYSYPEGSLVKVSLRRISYHHTYDPQTASQRIFCIPPFSLVTYCLLEQSHDIFVVYRKQPILITIKTTQSPSSRIPLLTDWFLLVPVLCKYLYLGLRVNV